MSQKGNIGLPVAMRDYVVSSPESTGFLVRRELPGDRPLTEVPNCSGYETVKWLKRAMVLHSLPKNLGNIGIEANGMRCFKWAVSRYFQ